MSTYCFILCRDDEERSGDVNYNPELLAAFLRARAQIDALAATEAFTHMDYVAVSGFCDSPDPLMFIAQHKGHRLVVANEYGDVYDAEGKNPQRASGQAAGGRWPVGLVGLARRLGSAWRGRSLACYNREADAAVSS